MIQKPRGTMDVLPKNVSIWQFIEKTAADTAKEYGFGEIRFPTFESTELFSRGVGSDTDVVQKEMYTFVDRDGRSLTLRPEGTACIARSLLENGLCSETMPLKLYYNINCFRYEKPQAGRSREFYQFGAELYGVATPEADASVLALADAVIRNLGIQKVSLHINSIGCPQCRPMYRAALKAYFQEKKEELCDTCKGRLESNPMRILDCKSPVCSGIAKNAPRTVDHLCPDCRTHMDKLEKILQTLKIPYTVDPKIVRGLDYYTRTVFEFIATDIGAQSTICGGGRYDGLVKELGGPELPGIGFAMGITRLILALENQEVTVPASPKPLLYIASMGTEAQLTALKITEDLRRERIYAECDIVGRSLKAQMKYSDKIGAMYTLIIGDQELEAGKAQLRCMKDSSQKEISFENIVAELKQLQ